MEGDDEGGGGQLGHCQVAARHQAGLCIGSSNSCFYQRYTEISHDPPRYFDKTLHNTTFMSVNVASLNVIVSKRKSFKT